MSSGYRTTPSPIRRLKPRGGDEIPIKPQLNLMTLGKGEGISITPFPLFSRFAADGKAIYF
jgi:hypothetical protein